MGISLNVRRSTRSHPKFPRNRAYIPMCGACMSKCLLIWILRCKMRHAVVRRGQRQNVDTSLETLATVNIRAARIASREVSPTSPPNKSTLHTRGMALKIDMFPLIWTRLSSAY
jgi:hypothetical protein